MKSLTLSILLAAGAALAGASHAQGASGSDFSPSGVYPSEPQWDGDASTGDPGPASGARSFDAGVAALDANDFARAEAIFDKSLRFYRNDPAFRFYMGVAKMNLGKWDEAKRYLRTAARELPKLPDPKGHLGVTYAKLGDIDAAKAQRAGLVKMAEACKGACELSPHIASGIQMIDEALAESSRATPSGQG